MGTWSIRRNTPRSAATKTELRARAWDLWTAEVGTPPVVLELFAGGDLLYSQFYRERVSCGVAVDNDPTAARMSAKRRPTWAVYCVDAVFGLESRWFDHYAPDWIDIDAFALAWRPLRATLALARRSPRPAMLVVAHEYVLRHGLKPHACGDPRLAVAGPAPLTREGPGALADWIRACAEHDLAGSSWRVATSVALRDRYHVHWVLLLRAGAEERPEPVRNGGADLLEAPPPSRPGPPHAKP